MGQRVFVQFYRRLTCALCLLFCIALPAQANQLPIWSELSYFERQTLLDLHKAQAGEPDALLALFMLASGNRELAAYENARRRVKAFVREFEESVIDEDEHWLLGEQLNKRMHDAFFLKHKHSGKAPSGYAEHQSRLAGIFETGEYNCISASLLYAVLTREFGIRTQGVLLPTHAFIQLNLSGGKTVEVETTSPSGYDQAHDQAFYERNSQTWYSERGLEPASYQDYLSRQIVDLTTLAAHNMLNQHTSADRMADADRFRLAEISAWLHPDNPSAQANRLSFYLQAAHQLLKDNQWQELSRMAETILPRVLAEQRYLPDDISHRIALSHLRAMFLYGYAQLANTAAVLHHMEAVMQMRLAFDEDTQEDLANKVLAAAAAYVENMAETESFDDGLINLSLLELHISSQPKWPEVVAWYYLHWADKYWQKKKWFEVTDILHDYFEQPFLKKDLSAPTKSLSSAYKNWGIDYLAIADLDAAKTVLQRCEERENKKKICQGIKADVESYEAKVHD